jgi:hypothetical protein
VTSIWHALGVYTFAVLEARNFVKATTAVGTTVLKIIQFARFISIWILRIAGDYLNFMSTRFTYTF